MFRSVMIPADLTAECDLLFRFACGLTELGVKRVVLGHVIEASGMEGPVIAAQIDKVRDQIRKTSRPLSDCGLDVEVRIGTGDPTHGLIGIATEAHVDAVIAGTHGAGIITKLFVGSVSEQIAVEANVPTMLIRYDLLRTKDDPAEFARSFGRSLLLPTDFSASSVRALMAALELPPRAIGTIYLMHILDKSLSGDKLQKAEHGAEFQLANQRKMVEEQKLSARCVIKQGESKRLVLQEADQRRVTGIIVGTRGQNALQEAMVGSTSMTLVRQASCPVLIVP